MSVGGTVVQKIERKNTMEYLAHDRSYPNDPPTHVLAERAEIEPQVGDQIWWQEGRIYFNNDRNTLVKIGNSWS